MAKRWRPFIDYTQPTAEREIKKHVFTQINLLEVFLGNFQRAVELMEHCDTADIRLQEECAAIQSNSPGIGSIIEVANLTEAMKVPWDWMQIAARDAVMTVYHFGQMLDALKRLSGKAPSLRQIDSERLKRAWKRFQKSFPLYEGLRHAVSHLADNMATPEKLEALYPEEGPLIQGALIKREYTMSHRNKHMTLSVTRETLAELDSIMTEAWEAFRPVTAGPA